MMYARGIPHHTFPGSEAGTCWCTAQELRKDLGKRAHTLLLKLGYVGVDAGGSTRGQPAERVVSSLVGVECSTYYSIILVAV